MERRIVIFPILLLLIVGGSGSEGKNETGDHHTGVHVASWRLDYVRVPLILSGFIIAVCIVKVGFHHLHPVAAVVPESCMLIILGLGIGLLFLAGSNAHGFLVFKPDTFFLFLLPPIILEAAYSLRDRAFMENVGTILLFAVVGTILNTFIVGAALHGLEQVGAMGSLSVGLFPLLIFSALIAAVDPVAVLAIFQDVGVNKLLYYMVFGESLFNDAVTVVLYNLMVTFAQMDTVTIRDLGLGLASFLCVSLGAAAIGIICGFITALITKFTSKIRVVEPTVMFGMAYFSYVLAELFHFSGIISIICCGLNQSQYAAENISSKSYITVHYFSKVASSVTESLIFIILGVMLVNDRSFWSEWSTSFSLLALLLVVLVRFIVIFFLTFVVNQFQHGIRKITTQEQFIMSYGGLRGAVSFSLVFMLSPQVAPTKNTLMAATYLVILFTVFVQGATIKPLVRILRITLQAKDLKLLKEINHGVMENLVMGIDSILAHYGSTYFKALSKYLSQRFLRPVVHKFPDRKGKSIVTTWKEMSMKHGLSAPKDTGDSVGPKSSPVSVPTAGANLWSQLSQVDSSALPSSFSDVLLDAQDQEKHKGLKQRRKKKPPKRQLSLDSAGDILHFRDMLMNPLPKTIHYGYGDRNLTAHPEDWTRLSHAARVHQVLLQSPKTTEPSVLRAALFPAVPGMAVSELTEDADAAETSFSGRQDPRTYQRGRFSEEDAPFIDV